jgi:gas vesicle structural protein
MPETMMSFSAPRDDEMSLLELADRLLNRGVVLTGEATISVAGVDLIYLGLNVVLTAVENLKKPGRRRAQADAAAAARGRDS